jgi:hypothetical protein
MAVFALSTKAGNSSGEDRTLLNTESLNRSLSDLVGLGTMATEILVVVVLRRITSVANLVQRLSLAGKGMPEIASRTELLPEL